MASRKSQRITWHSSNSTISSSSVTEHPKQWAKSFQSSCSACWTFTLTPNQRSDFHKLSFLTSLTEPRFLEKLRRNPCILCHLSHCYSWSERTDPEFTTKSWQSSFPLNLNTCSTWPEATPKIKWMTKTPPRDLMPQLSTHWKTLSPTNT